MALYPGEKAAPSTGDDVLVGRFTFRVVYRLAGSDEGLAIHIFGPVGGCEEEVLRFDCFRDQPHYHLGWSYRDERFIDISASRPFEWALDQIGSRMDQLLRAAGADSMEQVEMDGLPEALEAMRKLGEALEYGHGTPRR